MTTDNLAMPRLHVHFLPKLVDASTLAGSTCVVIDVLRATTTIVTALAAGAREVVPCLEVDDARRTAADLPSGSCLLGGERGGTPIDGFHHGNSPAEYTRERVAGKTLVFTTTNGTRAMQHCRQAAAVLIGAFVNLKAVCDRLETHQRVDLVCAGTDGHITLEDVLFAGAIVHAIRGHFDDLNDQAAIAADSFDALLRLSVEGEAGSEVAILASEMRKSHGGSNLVELGMASDVDLAAQIDRYAIVPELDLKEWRIK